MSILRKQHRERYTTIENSILEDKELSFRARGVAAFLFTKPNNWTISLSHLIASGSEGEKAIRTALQELAAAGYIMRKRERDTGGHVHTVTIIADYPAFKATGTAEDRINGYTQKTAIPDIPIPDMSVSDNSGMVSSLVKTDVVKTDVVKTEKATAASLPVLDDNDGRATLAMLDEYKQMMYRDSDTKSIAMRLEQDYTLEQIATALGMTNERHLSMITSGNRGITAPLAYTRKILVEEAEPKAKTGQRVRVEITVTGTKDSYKTKQTMSLEKAQAGNHTILEYLS